MSIIVLVDNKIKTLEKRYWYLIQSKPNQESIAKENLENQGYEVYLPLTSIRRRRNNRSKRVISPMFPRYLFIHLNKQTDDWGPIRSTIGVACLVRFGIEAAKVPNTLIESLRLKEDERGVHPMKETEYHEGERIRIAEGPFEGYEAIFSAKDEQQRVIVLLKIAEQYARLKVSENSIEKLQ